MRPILFAALMLAVPFTVVATPTHAAEAKFKPVLASSIPAQDQSGKEPVDSVTLNFTEEVELSGVWINLPYDEEMLLWETDYTPASPKKKGTSFTFPLPKVISEPGSYNVSYLLSTKRNPSINGFVHFTIEPEFPAPQWASTPAPNEEITAPLTQVYLQLDQRVDLILLEINRVTMQGDEVALTSVQNFMDGSTPETSVRNGDEFTFPLTTPLSEPGDYVMSYSYTVTNEDGSISPFTGMVNFTVK